VVAAAVVVVVLSSGCNINISFLPPLVTPSHPTDKNNVLKICAGGCCIAVAYDVRCPMGDRRYSSGISVYCNSGPQLCIPSSCLHRASIIIKHCIIQLMHNT